jgi:hypothetical protein
MGVGVHASSMKTEPPEGVASSNCDFQCPWLSEVGPGSVDDDDGIDRFVRAWIRGFVFRVADFTPVDCASLTSRSFRFDSR